MEHRTEEAISLLKTLISIPSLSRQEENSAAAISDFFTKKGILNERYGNNIVCRNKYFSPARPTVLLNSHHDTVKPNSGYTLDPFVPIEKDAKLFGLGSNDAGGALVSLIATFLYYYEMPNLQYNVVLVASAEEEISGEGGIQMVLPQLPDIDFALVGEPTGMQMAIAEKGLMVLDCEALGVAGHAARNEGLNAIYEAFKDLQWIAEYRFEKTSEWLGENKLTVTVMDTPNRQHNVVPDICRFVVDCRFTDRYTSEEVLQIMRQHMRSSITPRSTRLRSSAIATDHAVVQSGIAMGLTMFGSPTLSDKALMPFPALKIGPGDSARSHTANEFIYISEIESGIQQYIQLLDPLLQNNNLDLKA